MTRMTGLFHIVAAASCLMFVNAHAAVAAEAQQDTPGVISTEQTLSVSKKEEDASKTPTPSSTPHEEPDCQ